MTSSSLAEQLRDELRQLIITIELPPGALVLEKSLATQFGVSKTPVREALQMLASEGWVQVIPRRGYMVTTMGFHDIREVMRLRQLIEPFIAAEAAANRTDELITDLQKVLSEQIGAPGPAESLDAARRFHERIAVAARNTRAAHILELLRQETIRAHRLLPSLDCYFGNEAEFAAHRAVLAGIDAADRDRAEEAMRSHLRESEELMISAFYG